MQRATRVRITAQIRVKRAFYRLAKPNHPSLLNDIRRGRRLVLRGAGARGAGSARNGVGLRSSVRSEKRREPACVRSAMKNVWNQVRMPSTGLASRHCPASARVRVA